MQQEQRQYRAETLSHRQSRHEAVLSEHPVQQEQQGDIENQFPDDCVDHRALSITYCLQAIGRIIVDELHGRSQAADPEEGRRKQHSGQCSTVPSGGRAEEQLRQRTS